jgi:hypothetical protein
LGWGRIIITSPKTKPVLATAIIKVSPAKRWGEEREFGVVVFFMGVFGWAVELPLFIAASAMPRSDGRSNYVEWRALEKSGFLLEDKTLHDAFPRRA